LYLHNRRSPSAYLLGTSIERLGWKKEIEQWDLGVVDAFLRVLRESGVDDGEGERIGEEEVAERVFSLWVGQVQRGEAKVGKGTVGMFDQRWQWRKKVVLEGVEREKVGRSR
jgi:hypothetical protein